MKRKVHQHIVAGAIALLCLTGGSATAVTFVGWDQDPGGGLNNDSRLSSYPSAANIANNTNLLNIGFGGSHIWDDIATDGTTFFAWDQDPGGGLNNDSRLTSYASASDLANNVVQSNIGFGGSHIWDAIATDGSTFFAYDAETGRLSSYGSASDLATNNSLTNIGLGAKTTFESVATDGFNFYGWDQGNNNNSTLTEYASAADFASDTNGVTIGSTGSHIWDAIAAAQGTSPDAPEPDFATVAQFDVNSDFGHGGTFFNQAPFAPLDNTGTGTQNGITLTTSSSALPLEFRDRGTGGPLSGHPNADLLRDFLFENDGSAPREMTFDLEGLTPDTLHEITVFSFDNGGNNGTRSFWFEDDSEGLSLLTHTQSSDPNAGDFTLRLLSDANGMIRIVALSDTQASSLVIFNGMQVAEVIPTVPEPTTGLLALMGIGGLVARRRRQAA